MKTVIVLGMHRSGTSIVAGIINKLHVNMGKKLLGKSWTNPYGHFEDEDFMKLNVRILQSSGGSWDNPPVQNDICAQKSKFEVEIKDLVRTKNRNHFWGWKDPRTSLTMELYMPYLRKPHFIVVHRSEQCIVDSLQRRNKITEESAGELIKIYQSRIKALLDQYSDIPTLHISYEDLTNNPEMILGRIVTFLKLSISEKKYRKAVSMFKSRDELRKLSKFLWVIDRIKKFFRWPAKRLYHFLRGR